MNGKTADKNQIDCFLHNNEFHIENLTQGLDI